MDGRPGYIGFIGNICVTGTSGIDLQQVEDTTVEVVQWIIDHVISLGSKSVNHLPGRSEEECNDRIREVICPQNQL